jgi:hypothetical protein
MTFSTQRHKTILKFHNTILVLFFCFIGVSNNFIAMYLLYCDVHAGAVAVDVAWQSTCTQQSLMQQWKRQKKYKRLKLGGGQAYHRSSD